MRWLPLLWIITIAAASFAHKHVPIDDLLPGEYGTSVIEFAQTWHISSTFSSPGYAVIVGTAVHFVHGTRGLFTGNLIIYLGWVTMIWVLLQQLGLSVRQAVVAAAIFALYPDVLSAINKSYQTILTNLAFLAFVVAAIYFVRSRTRYAADIVFAIALGLVLFCRSNVILCLPAVWITAWRYNLPRAFTRSVAQAVFAFVLYAAGTLAVHGSVFWPDVGSYVLFSGANEYTQQVMKLNYNETAEGSLIPALKLRGIDAYHDWAMPDDLPGDNEIRNHRFTHLYTQEAIRFARRHPRTMVKLTALKARDFFRPDWAVHPAGSFSGLLKLVAALALPAWIVLCFLIPQRSADPSRLLCALTILFFVLAHLVTVAAPRFRICIDVLCFLNIIAMLTGWIQGKQQRDPAPSG